MQKTVQASTTKNRLGHKTETAQITTFTKQNHTDTEEAGEHMVEGEERVF